MQNIGNGAKTKNRNNDQKAAPLALFSICLSNGSYCAIADLLKVLSTEEPPYKLISVCEQNGYYPLKLITWIASPSRDLHPTLTTQLTEPAANKKVPLYLTYNFTAEYYETHSFGCAVLTELGDIDFVIYVENPVVAYHPPSDITIVERDGFFWCLSNYTIVNSQPKCIFDGSVDGSRYYLTVESVVNGRQIECNTAVSSNLPTTLSCSISTEEFGITERKLSCSPFSDLVKRCNLYLRLILLSRYKCNV